MNAVGETGIELELKIINSQALSLKLTCKCANNFSYLNIFKYMMKSKRVIKNNYKISILSLIAVLGWMIISCDDEITSPNQVGNVDVGVAYDVYLENKTAYVSNNNGVRHRCYL